VASPAVPSDPVRLIFAGRLSIQKNPLFFSKPSPPETVAWRLDIYGDGPLKGAAEHQAVELGLDPGSFSTAG